MLQFSGFTVTTQINIIPRHLSPDKLREERPSKDTKAPHAFKASLALAVQLCSGEVPELVWFSISYL